MKYLIFLLLSATANAGGFRMLDNDGNPAVLESSSFDMTPITAKFDAAGSSTATLRSTLDLTSGSTQTLRALIDGVSNSTQVIQNNVGASTKTLETRDFSIGASTLALRGLLDLTSGSTQTLRGFLDLTSNSTQTLRGLLDLTSMSTRTVQNNVGASTLALTTLMFNVGGATKTIQDNVGVSTKSLQDQIDGLGPGGLDFGPSTGSLRTDMFSVGAATLAIQNNVGSATATLKTQDFNIGASTLALTILMTNVGASTKTIQNDVGASTKALSDGKQNSFVGSNISVCAADQYFGGATAVNGVITSGVCRTDAGAGGGETNTYTSSKTFTSDVSAFSLYVSSTIMLNDSGPVLSSGAVTIWMLNQSTRIITAGELVIRSTNGTSTVGMSGAFSAAAATTTVIGIAINQTAQNAWGKVAILGMVKVWCGSAAIATACIKGRRVVSGGLVTTGRAIGLAAPAAHASVGIWLETTAINTQGWVLLK